MIDDRDGADGEFRECAIVTTSMGRLHHLRESLPTWLEHTPWPVVVVDWGCTDGSVGWARQQGPRVQALAVPGQREFHKTRALNLGLTFAIDYALVSSDASASWLLVLDADTKLRAGFAEWIAVNLDRRGFAFAQGHADQKDLSGMLLVRADHLLRSGGYDESFRGWGLEDWDMRCRLHFGEGLPWTAIPWQLAEAIKHENSERVRYQDQSKTESYRANWARINRNVKSWTGRELHELSGREVRWLFGGFW